MIWLLAQENGWPSLESVFERYYGLLDPDLLVGYNRGYLELFQYFYSKEISFFQNIKDCSEMRKKIWDSYIKRRINYHDEHDFLSEHNPDYQDIVRKFRNLYFFHESVDETQ